MPGNEAMNRDTEITWKTPPGSVAHERREAVMHHRRDLMIIACLLCVGYALRITHARVGGSLSFFLHHVYSWPALSAAGSAALLAYLLAGRASYRVGEQGVAYKEFYKWRTCEWNHILSYRIEDADYASGLKVLIFYRRMHIFEDRWPFDPNEIDEQAIRTMFEEHDVAEPEEIAESGGS